MKTIFYHGKTQEGLRFTIAGSFSESLIKTSLRLGISICSEKDNFCKKTGRIRSEGRMNQKNNNAPGSCTMKVSLEDPKETIKTFVKVVSTNFEGKPKKEIQKVFNLS